MSAKIKKSASFVLALITMIASFAFVLPHSINAYADENTTPIGDEASLKAALEGDGGSYSLSADISLTVSEYEEYRYTVSKAVSLDLNGFSVTVVNNANLGGNTSDSTLIKIENGGSLTINDSSADKNGSLSYKGGIHLYSEELDYTDFSAVTGRHLIYLSEGAFLTVNGGSLTAGNVEKEWLHRAAGIVGKAFEYYTGFAENTVCGTVITTSGDSTLTVNGGSFTAHGRKRQNALPNLKGWDEEQSVSVTVRAEANATVNINDGYFVGAHGADVFSFNVDSKTLVMAGKFETTPSKNERIVDYMEFAAVNTEEYYGRINLPTVFIPRNSRDALSQGGAPLDKVANAVNGTPVYLTPYTANTTSISSSNITANYEPGAKGSVSVNYKPYFTEGSTISYAWYAVSVKGNITPLSSSNTSTLDLSKLSNLGVTLSIGTKYSFRCVVTEKYGSYTLTTVARSFNLETKNKYILAAVKLTPSKIDDKNFYYAGNIPKFSVPSNSNYSLSSVMWFERYSSSPIADGAKLKPNSSYYAVFTLKAKGSYLFTLDSRVSFLPGGNEVTIIPSVDGKSATVSAWIYTACDHSKTDYLIDDLSHAKLCTICGSIISSESHIYTQWSESPNAITESETDAPDTSTTPPETDTDVSETDTDTPETSTNSPETSTDPSETDSEPPVTDTDPPVSDTEPPVTDTDPPVTDPPVVDPVDHDKVPMQRVCAVCSHIENSGAYAPVAGHKTPIYEVKVDFGLSALKTPALLSTPNSSMVQIVSHSWTDANGNAVSSFAGGQVYYLTVKYAVTDKANYIFGKDTVLSSLLTSTASATYSSDMSEMTVVYKLVAPKKENKDVYLPPVNSGQSIVNTTATVSGKFYSFYWYRDGALIGHITVNNGIKEVIDDNTADGIDFSTAVFDSGKVYHCRIYWNVIGTTTVLADQIKFTNSPDVDRSTRTGELSFATAYYLPLNTDSLVRTVKVSGITAPVAGSTPKTSGASVTSGCKVKSISFSCNGQSVSKFECGKTYTVKVTVSAASGYTLSVIAAAVNGNGASISKSGSNLVLTYTFPALEHNFDNRNTENEYPTCSEAGSITAKCKYCSETSVTALEKGSHALVKITGKDATCSENGSKEHYYCLECFKIFSDADASTEATKESVVIAKDETKHTEYSKTVHDGNDHFTVCSECSSSLGDNLAHEYGDDVTDSEGNVYFFCECGHYVSETGPKIPEFVIGGSDEQVTPPGSNGFGFGNFSMKTIKTILLLMIIFAVLLVGSIIAISIILIVTRDRSGKQPLPEEIGSESAVAASVDSKE